jgi:hypothetical protein
MFQIPASARTIGGIMVRNLQALGCLSVALCSCASPAGLELSRLDGAPVDPLVQEKAKTECSARSQVVTAGAPPRVNAYGISWMVAQEQAQQAAFQGCMAEKGIRVKWISDTTRTEMASVR